MQGAYKEHINILQDLDVSPVEIRNKNDLQNIDGIIIPGGESTTMGKLIRTLDIYDDLKEKIESGMPVWGTCAGMDVIIGILEEECKELNEVFMKYIVTKKPFVVLKTAMTLDGKIATASGESKWITSDKSRKEVHKLRNELSAIMVGVNTVIKDNPKLTCRIEGGKNPVRIFVDSKLRIPTTSEVVVDNLAKTIVATTELADKEKILALEKLGVKVVITKSKNNRVNLQSLMIELGKIGIDGILLEGGATLSFSALEENIVDKIQVYIAPKIIGGEKSKTSIGGQGIKKLSDAIELKDMTVKSISPDLLVEAYLRGGEK